MLVWTFIVQQKNDSPTYYNAPVKIECQFVCIQQDNLISILKTHLSLSAFTPLSLLSTSLSQPDERYL